MQTNAHNENAIKIPSFNGDENDSELLDHLPFLEALAQIPDVRPVAEKFLAFQAGENLLKPQMTQSMVVIENESSFMRFFGKIAGSFLSRKTQEEEQPRTQRNRIKSEIIVTPTKYLTAQLSQRNSVPNRGSVRADVSPALRESILSVGALEVSFDESSSAQTGSFYPRRSVPRDDDESDHTALMDEISEGQQRKNLLKVSLPMRSKPQRTFML